VIGEPDLISHGLTPERANAIAALVSAFAAASICADACLAAPDPARLADCIRSCDHVASTCSTAAGAMLRPRSDSSLQAALARAAIRALEHCGRLCDEHADYVDQCGPCASVCRRAESATRSLLPALDANVQLSSTLDV